MPFFFLKKDFDELDEKIKELDEKIIEIGKEIGESCKESSDTWHDNFDFEDGKRQQRMLSDRLRELVNIRNSAQIVKPSPLIDKVSLGKQVVVEDIETGNTEVLIIGSYMVLNRKKGTVSYNAPLGRLLIGASVGEIKRGVIVDREKSIKILKIE